MILLRRYATAWEGQIGRFWYGINYPSFWLYSKHRAAEIKKHGRTARCSRAWLYHWPMFIRITDREGNVR